LFSANVSAGVFGPAVTGTGAAAGDGSVTGAEVEVVAGAGAMTGVEAAAGVEAEVEAGTEVAAVAVAGAAAGAAAAAPLLFTALAVELAPAGTAPAGIVFFDCVGEWHPASNVAATNMIGTILRITERAKFLFHSRFASRWNQTRKLQSSVFICLPGNPPVLNLWHGY